MIETIDDVRQWVICCGQECKWDCIVTRHCLNYKHDYLDISEFWKCSDPVPHL
jgi:hypothetical protein